MICGCFLVDLFAENGSAQRAAARTPKAINHRHCAYERSAKLKHVVIHPHQPSEPLFNFFPRRLLCQLDRCPFFSWSITIGPVGEAMINSSDVEGTNAVRSKPFTGDKVIMPSSSDHCARRCSSGDGASRCAGMSQRTSPWAAIDFGEACR